MHVQTITLITKTENNRSFEILLNAEQFVSECADKLLKKIRMIRIALVGSHFSKLLIKIFGRRLRFSKIEVRECVIDPKKSHEIS